LHGFPKIPALAIAEDEIKARREGRQWHEEE
jgi:hypothetical protein